MNVYAEDGEEYVRIAKALLHGREDHEHPGHERYLVGVEYRPIGSGANGPHNADYGVCISALKQNVESTDVVGEVDGLNIIIRQGGPNSDCAGILANVSHYGTGFSAALESYTTNVVNAAIATGVRVQLGVVDSHTGLSFGLHIVAENGSSDWGIRISALPGASFTTPIEIQDALGNLLFAVGGDGGVNSSAGIHSKIGFAVGGKPVVLARDEGWEPFSGILDKATPLNTETCTVKQLARRVAQLQATLAYHGLIG